MIENNFDLEKCREIEENWGINKKKISKFVGRRKIQIVFL